MAKLIQTFRILIIVLIILLFTTNVYSAQPALVKPHPVYRSLEQQEHKLLGENLLAQVTNINQLQDVSPKDRYYEALQQLVERYGIDVALNECPFTDVKLSDCKQPIFRFRANAPLLRRNFIVYLNDALNNLNKVILSSFGNVALSRDDIEVVASQLTHKSRSLEQEVTQIEARLNALEQKLGK